MKDVRFIVHSIVQVPSHGRYVARQSSQVAQKTNTLTSLPFVP